ncbi:MAG: response regulator transcription factor [Thermodesulfobacteriota bacterium]
MAGRQRIVIVEDHTILRDGLRALLSSNPDFEVVGEAGDGREAVIRVEELSPDLVLLDLSLPRRHGLDAIHEMKRSRPQTRILVLTVHKNEEYILAALKAGADGYVLKEASHQELEMAIRTVVSGKRYLSPDVSDLVIEGYLEGKKAPKAESGFEALTPREREILKLIAEGYTSRQIASQLFISLKTVERHRANLMKKLDRHGISALTSLALEKGLIAP